MLEIASMGVAVVTVAACAMAPTYTAPSSGDKAELIVRMRIGADEHFSLEVYDDAQACKGRKKVLASGDTGQSIVTSLRANALSTVNFYESRGNSQCDMYGSFFPKANRSYVLDTLMAGGSCLMRVMDVTNPKAPRPEPVVRRKKEATGCTPLSQDEVATLEAANPVSARPTMDDFKSLLPKK
ncbi:hypothetical protein ACO0LO_26160 [Undibacterium sp. TJN25]|uniref:hypothetical protein n=1 Tax=Undibacterium sp. TJN25 TaxID=3413056 RepID=UPI003BF3F42E